MFPGIAFLGEGLVQTKLGLRFSTSSFLLWCCLTIVCAGECSHRLKDLEMRVCVHMCVCVLGVEVQKDEYRLVSKLLAWSLKHAAAGRFPMTGFANEEFDPKTLRGALKGQVLAQGWRCFTALNVSYAVFGFASSNQKQFPPGPPTCAHASMAKLVQRRIALNGTTSALSFAKAVWRKTL